MPLGSTLDSLFEETGELVLVEALAQAKVRPSKILITGSRDWTDGVAIREVLSLFPKGTKVIHGAQRGADSLAAFIAKDLGLIPKGYPADFTNLGKKAGPIRNQQMLDAEHSEEDPIILCLAFPLPSSKGTWDMVGRCKVAIPLIPHLQVKTISS